MTPRMRSRMPISIGSNQVSSNKPDDSPDVFLLSLSMVWSPSASHRRIACCISRRLHHPQFPPLTRQHRAAGVDGLSIEDFDRDLSRNLYRIWNRMCSGSYFPPPVRRVDIPKGDSGGTRPLGIPTVSARIAQTVVKRYLAPILQPRSHKDSYGYRPGKSAHE